MQLQSMFPNYWTEAKVLYYGKNISLISMIPLQKEIDRVVQLEQK